MGKDFLTPTSVLNIGVFTLSLVIAGYLLSLKDKSKNTWIFITVLLGNVYYLFAFFVDFTHSELLSQIRIVWLFFAFLFQMWFAYMLGGNPYKTEIYIALIVGAIIISIIFYKNSALLLLIPVWMFVQFWNWVLFLRKAARAGKKGSGSLMINQHHSTNSLVTAFRQLLYPSNRQSRMFRDYSLWSLMLMISSASYGLVYILGIGWLRSPLLQYIDAPMQYVYLTYLTIVFLNYSVEKTSLQAKLIGVVLCVVLVLLGVLPLILFGTNIRSSQEEQKALLNFIILIPVSTLIILLVFPLFFKYNLLKPLNHIVEGVKKVNAGELETIVSVEVKDELGSLAKDFNEMTSSLRHYSNEMEELVAIRTEELSQSLKELKAAQAQLIHSEKMASLGELTTGIAHEIQNPLNFVNNFSEVSRELIDELKSQKSTLKSEEQDELLDDIDDNLQKINEHGKRADAIVKGMLQHSRVSTGKKELTDINALADEYLRLSYHGLRAKDKDFNAEFKTDCDESIGKIEVVPQDIGRVLLNLYNNAFYAVNEKKKLQNETFEPLVTITTKRSGDRVEIVVQDNGPGIPQKIIEKIFQPFFTTKPTGQGTGLGLSLSYDIIKAHGGEIRVESKEGEGSEFVVQLPIQIQQIT